MRGLVLQDVGVIALRDDLPEPRIEAPTDAVVAVRAAGLCGSDLHPYRGAEAAATGVVQGHELVGDIIEVGADVDRFAVGDRVLAAFTTSCLHCPPCRAGLTGRCRNGQLFGWGPPGDDGRRTLPGAQAERVRIPLADGTLVRVPVQLDDTAGVLLADNLPTGWEAVIRTGPRSEQALVVVGLGSVGLSAVAAALALGVSPVIGVDPVVGRRRRALELGAHEAVPPDDAHGAVQALTRERHASAVVEAAGSMSGQRLAFELTAPGGTLSIIAVQTAERFAFDPVAAYDRTLTVTTGRASVRATLDDVLARIESGTLTVPVDQLVTHPEVALDDGPAFYARFAAHEDGLVKAVFRP
jgi:alcohol dehydrogenase